MTVLVGWSPFDFELVLDHFGSVFYELVSVCKLEGRRFVRRSWPVTSRSQPNHTGVILLDCLAVVVGQAGRVKQEPELLGGHVLAVQWLTPSLDRL